MSDITHSTTFNDLLGQDLTSASGGSGNNTRSGDFVASQQTQRSRLSASMKADIDKMMDEFRDKLLDYATSHNVKSAAVQQYAWKPKQAPSEWDMFQGSEVGKDFVKEYQNEHQHATPSQAFDAFKMQKAVDGLDVADALADSFAVSQSLKLNKGQTSTTNQQRYRIMDRLLRVYQALFYHLERQHGLSFVWLCVSSHSNDDFQASVVTPNAYDTLRSLRRDYVTDMINDLGTTLKGDRVRAWYRHISSLPGQSNSAEGDPAEGTSAECNVAEGDATGGDIAECVWEEGGQSLSQKREILKGFLRQSYMKARTEASPNKPPAERENIQYQEKQLNKYGISLSLDSEIDRKELARGGSNNAELNKFLQAVKEGKIKYVVLPSFRRPVERPGKRRRTAAIASVSSELRAPFGGSGDPDESLRQQTDGRGGNGAGAIAADNS
ncbi:hypothetical protein B9479_008168 [Cryptococcus floricola]|uniref:Uncharacterized protein n=1 Tax=Cryptococcus floricola TaxID=2591691 RepID=A0A5D3AM26_9TREE|nr:hypothetical protein B9479_008168 [Cryptococcus floricola]